MSLHGIAAMFHEKEALVEAAGRLREAGFRRLEAFSPTHVEELDEILQDEPREMPWIFFVAGLVGCLGGFLLCTWSAVVDWPFNVGGRPDFSWPSFMPVAFETTVLMASVCGFVGLMIRCGLPRLHHPMFGVPGFEGVTRDRFFLCVEAADPAWDADRVRRLLAETGAREVTDVPA